MTITILKPGAWGTALGIVLHKKHRVRFWYENADFAEQLAKTRLNSRLTGVTIPPDIQILSDLDATLHSTALIIVASPSFRFRETLLHLREHVPLPPLLGIAKGIEQETLKLPSQIVEELFDDTAYAHLSGPGFAQEVVQRVPAQELIAAKSKTLLRTLNVALNVEPLVISTTTDMMGVQLAGALKNVYAIGISLATASSAARSKAMLNAVIALAVREMQLIGVTLGAQEATFQSPAGRGDLRLTATNELSRNFQFGRALATDARKLRQKIITKEITVEGFESLHACHTLAQRHDCALPFLDAIYRVVYEGTSPKKAIKQIRALALNQAS